ncbi:MAG TPA: FixH family protein [Nevskiales bacterium]|nr:FixH family protein [Nevskiales bacterium]
MKPRAAIAVVLLPALLAGCGRHDTAASPAATEIEIPPAEARPANIGPIKWVPESPRYQQIRRAAFREGTDFSARVDFSHERQTRQGRYRVRILERVSQAQGFESWRLLIVDADKRPVAGASLQVSGGMPEHGHGLPTRPRVTRGGAPGEYRVEGLQFSMPGWWEVSLYIYSQQRDDSVTFNIQAG